MNRDKAHQLQHMLQPILLDMGLNGYATSYRADGNFEINFYNHRLDERQMQDVAAAVRSNVGGPALAEVVIVDKALVRTGGIKVADYYAQRTREGGVQ